MSSSGLRGLLKIVQAGVKKTGPKKTVKTKTNRQDVLRQELYNAPTVSENPQLINQAIIPVKYTNEERSGVIGGVFENITDSSVLNNKNATRIEIGAGKFPRMAVGRVGENIPVGNPAKGAVNVDSNMIKAPLWKWEGNIPEGLEDAKFLVSLQSPGAKNAPHNIGKKTANNHLYAANVIYEKGGNITAKDTRALKDLVDKADNLTANEIEALLEFPNLSLEESKEYFNLVKQLINKSKKLSKEEKDKAIRSASNILKGDNPKGKPYTKGFLEFGNIIGTIKVGKNQSHPLYDNITVKAEGGSIVNKKTGGRVESNPYGTNYQRFI